MTYAPWVLAGVLLTRWWPCSRALILCGPLLLAIGADSVWQRFAGVDWFGVPMHATRTRAFLPHPNDLALVPLLLPFAPLWSWPAAIVAIWLSHSRNALLGLAVVLILESPRRHRRAVTLAILLLALVWWWSRGPALDDFGRAWNAVSGRFGFWTVGVEMWQAAPWLGTGPHTFVDHYMKALARGTLAFGLTPEMAFIPWMHSLYLELLGERGILGLLAVATPMIWAWRVGTSHIRVGIAVLAIEGILDLTFIKPWVVGVYAGLIVLAAEQEDCVRRASPDTSEGRRAFTWPSIPAPIRRAFAAARRTRSSSTS